MTIITTQQLEDLCSSLSETEYIYYPISKSYFKDLYTTGCRPQELLTITRWNYINASNIILDPLKNNNNRTFTAAELSNNLLQSIITQVEPYESLSLRQLSSVLKKILPVLRIQTIEKSAIDYMFRYNRVRQLFAQGQTAAQLATKFGWINPNLAYSYGNKTLYSSTPLPPPTGSFITDSNGDKIIDFNGDFVNY